jgi:hypothetical protein
MNIYIYIYIYVLFVCLFVLFCLWPKAANDCLSKLRLADNQNSPHPGEPSPGPPAVVGGESAMKAGRDPPHQAYRKPTRKGVALRAPPFWMVFEAV